MVRSSMDTPPPLTPPGEEGLSDVLQGNLTSKDVQRRARRVECQAASQDGAKRKTEAVARNRPDYATEWILKRIEMNDEEFRWEVAQELFELYHNDCQGFSQIACSQQQFLKTFQLLAGSAADVRWRTE